MDEKTVNVSGAAIRYLEGGEGEPVLFLPSASGRAAEYRDVASFLENSFHLYAIDYPGFGRSEALPKITGMEDLAVFVVRWMEAVGLLRCHLVGFSLGGWIGLSLAFSRPESVLKLILIATSAGQLPDVPIISPSGMTYPEILDQFYYRPEVREKLAGQKRTAAEKEEIFRSSRAFMQLVRQQKIVPEFHDRLGEIRMPTLIVGADRDRAIPLPYQERLHAGISGSKLIVFKETGHAIVAERPEELAGVIENFLKGGDPNR